MSERKEGVAAVMSETSDLLRTLREFRVKVFQGYGLHVEFGPYEDAASPDAKPEPAPSAPKDMGLDDPDLYLSAE